MKKNIHDKRKLKDLMRWLFTRKPSKWPKKLKNEVHHAPPQRVGMGELRTTFVNHSTVLVQMDDINILTDPIWSNRCGPFRWAGLKRVIPPGVHFDDLPPIDIVLVSHNHYDHMDIPTLRKLQKHHHPVFCISKGNRKFLEKKGIKNILEFDLWDEHVLLKKLPITFVPAKHFSRRGLWDENKSLWGGFIIEGSKGSVFFAGDTAYSEHFKEIYKKFGAPRLALIPIGAYSPRWMMQSVHMCPEESVQAHMDLNAANSLAIHFGTFRLSDEGIDEPIVDLAKAMLLQQIEPEHFWVLKPGEGRDVPVKMD